MLQRLRMHAAPSMYACCNLYACMLQIQRNLGTDDSTGEMQKVALLPDSKAKIGASLGYNVRTLLRDLGMEVRCSSRPSSWLSVLPVRA